MTDWTKISNNPASAEVFNIILSDLKKKNKGICRDYLNFLRNFVFGFHVIDIGAIGHDLNKINKNQWKHKLILDWSSSAVGIDICDEKIKSLRDLGYNILNIDATSDRFIGFKYDRIVIGDVIEHVSNPTKLLAFAKRHLKENGLIMVVTPNPFWIVHIWQNIKSGTILTNAEHISWISPCMALELGRRSDLLFKEYWLLQTPVRDNGKFMNKVLKKLLYNLIGHTELMNNKFIYLYENH